MHTIAELKRLTLSLDDPRGVGSDTFHKVTDAVRTTMGPDAADVLIDAMEKEDDTFFFPNDGDGLRTWKRMLVAYKEEKGIVA